MCACRDGGRLRVETGVRGGGVERGETEHGGVGRSRWYVEEI